MEAAGSGQGSPPAADKPEEKPSAPEEKPSAPEEKPSAPEEKPSAPEEKKSWWKKMASVDRSQLAALGTSCLLSYGFISNASYITSLLIATYTAMSITGASPLTNSVAFKKFAASYAGLWMIQNFLRPARVAFAVAFGPLFDRIVVWIQSALKLRSKAWAFGVTVFLINFCGTVTFMIGGFACVSLWTGVPMGWSELGSFMKAASLAKNSAAA